MSAGDADSALQRGPMLLVAGIGIVAFIAMLVLGAYAPDFRSGGNGGTHGLSSSAVGFSGLVRLAADTGRSPLVVRNQRQFASEDMLIVSPDSDAANLDTILAARGGRVTLIILPKWRVQADPKHAGWVRSNGLHVREIAEKVLAPRWKLDVSRHKSRREPLTSHGPAVSPDSGFVAPLITQTISGKDLVPVLTDSQGRILLGQLGKRPLYVLADPDLLNNRGLADRRQAAAGLRLLDDLNSTSAENVLFDVTANGLGHSRSPLRLAFDPPFLAVTLTLFAAMALAGWQMLVRFGVPLPAQRALAFGKAALVDNSAALIRRAGRETGFGASYADVMRRRAESLFRLPAGLSPEARDIRLDGLGQLPFSVRAANAASARSRPELVAAAQSLHDWIQEVRQ
jgi:hypothetical protein